MSAIVLNVAAGATVTVQRTDTGLQASTLYCLRIDVTRNWVWFRAGTAAGLDDRIATIRLEPGTHVLNFTAASPAGDVVYQIFRDRQGIAAVTKFTYLAAGDLELMTPYAGADLRGLRVEQSGDVLWFFHPLYAWRGLERRNNRSWSLRAWRPIDGPFLPPNVDTSMTLTPSALTGEATLTATADVFDAGHVGALFQLTHVGQLRTATVDAANEWTEAIRVTGVDADRVFSLQIEGTFTGVITLQRSVGDEFSWTDFRTYSSPSTFSVDDTFDNQIIYYRAGVASRATVSAPVTLTLAYSGGVTTGVARIVSVLSARAATADVVQQLGGTTPTSDWAEGSWSTLRGWPAAGALFDGRLWLAGQRSLWGSRPDDFLSFAAGPEDDDAVNATLAVGDISPIEWLVGAQMLMVGTEASELQVRSTTFEEPITPTNRSVRERSVRGSANVAAVRFGTRVFFVSRSALRLIALQYDLDSNGYVDADLTRLHQVIGGDGGFVALDVQHEPEPRLLLVRADGQVVALTYNTNEQVIGFTRLPYDGHVEDLCVLPGTPEDSVYYAVRRGGHIDIERSQPERWTDLADAWRLRDALKYEGPPATVLSGLSHLEGVEVGVWADGSEHPPRTVSGGSITLERAAPKAIVGRQYVGRYKSSRLAYGGDLGTALGELKRVNAVTLLTYRTPRAALRAGLGARFGSAPEIPRGQLLDTRLAETTEEIRLSLQSGSVTDPRLIIEMVGSGPATVLGYVPEVQTNSRDR